jgi:hypothetical protein
MTAYAEKIRAELPPQRGKGRIFKVFRFLEELVPVARPTPANLSRTYCTEASRRGLAVVISDFMDPAAFKPGLDYPAALRHDIFVIHVASHEECEPVLKGELVSWWIPKAMSAVRSR